MSQSYEASALVALSPDHAFALAHSLGSLRTVWDTQVVKRMLLRDATELGEGALVFERVRNGRRVILQQDLWIPGQLSSATMVKGPWWLKQYGEGWHFTPVGDETRVTWKVTLSHRSPVFATQAEVPLTAALRFELTNRMDDYAAAARDADLMAQIVAGVLSPDARHRDVRRHPNGSQPSR